MDIATEGFLFWLGRLEKLEEGREEIFLLDIRAHVCAHTHTKWYNGCNTYILLIITTNLICLVPCNLQSTLTHDPQ